MEPGTVRRRLAAILSTDAVGYSRRMAEDDVATVGTLRSHRETIRGLVRKHHGEVVDAVGDNLLAEFSSAVDAVACAVEVQRRLGERNGKLPEERRLPFRIGLHLGDLLVEDGQLYGDGINIAARLEGLAEPGGICASGAIIDQVRGKVDASYVDLGEPELKNIPVPVRAWRVAGGAGAGEAPSPPTVPGFGGRPAIAVLPFEDRSNDPDQAYLADGIVEDVIARLSAFRLFPVIARSSTFAYRGSTADARRVSRELGARYVVEGSVRKAGNRIRVVVEVIDGSSAHQIHSERYDRELGDVFELQDEIAEKLIGAIEPAISLAERRRAEEKPTASLNAWEALQRGNSFARAITGPELAHARTWFRRAAELDPGFAPAYAAIARTLWEDFQAGRTDDPEATLTEALDLAQKSIRLAPDDPAGHVAHAMCLSQTSGATAALRACERAVELNPSDSMGWTFMANLLVGERPDEALALATKALRLDPLGFAASGARYTAGLCCLCAGHWDEAIRWVREAIEQEFRPPGAYRVLAAALGHAGRLEEARAALDDAMRRAPNFTLTQLHARNSTRLVGAILDGWKKAGWSPPPDEPGPAKSGAGS